MTSIIASKYTILITLDTDCDLNPLSLNPCYAPFLLEITGEAVYNLVPVIFSVTYAYDADLFFSDL